MVRLTGLEVLDLLSRKRCNIERTRANVSLRSRGVAGCSAIVFDLHSRHEGRRIATRGLYFTATRYLSSSGRRGVGRSVVRVNERWLAGWHDVTCPYPARPTVGQSSDSIEDIESHDIQEDVAYE